jgi:hypothetical protein
MKTGTTREFWVETLVRIARPVLTAMAEKRLHKSMPVKMRVDSQGDRREFAHLEAIGRTLSGIAPWLELGPDETAEGKLRGEFCELARAALDAATNPASPDFCNFVEGSQTLVDTGILSEGLLRAPRELVEKLDAKTRRNLVAALKTTRTRKPWYNNHLLFCGTTEAALCRMGEEWDPMRVDYAFRQHEQWYLGDGVYADGPEFHWDYYNSFVIHPMLVDMIRVFAEKDAQWKEFYEPIHARSRRYAAVLERMISPEGTYPPLGRSIVYRFGAFHTLGQMALLHLLPEGVMPSQVRCALTAVIKRMVDAPGMFDEEGWLQIGFCGAQPDLAEPYICTGSLYECLIGLLPLGLAQDDPFWSAPDAPWTAVKLWGGVDQPRDASLGH